MKSPYRRIRLILASSRPMIRGILAESVRHEPDIDVAVELGDSDPETEILGSEPTYVVLLDGLRSEDHSDEFVARLNEILPDGVVLLTPICELSPELEALMRRIPRTWGHVAICEPPEAVVETVRRVASGEPREPHQNDGGVCEVHERELHKILSETERTILKLVAQGLSSKVIAERLGVTDRSVQGHRLRLSKKLGIQSSAALVRYAVRAGLISP